MILVVEDHDDTRQALVRLLQRTGYDAVGVRNGNEALLFLQTHQPPRLVILDQHMPGLDGLDVLRAIRADRRLDATAVVMFTADATDERRAEADALGAQGFVAKGSLDWGQLSVLIERYTRESSQKSAAPESSTPTVKDAGQP